MLRINAQLIMCDTAICLDVTPACKVLGDCSWLTAQHALVVFKEAHYNLHSHLHSRQIYNLTAYLVNNLLLCFMLN